jgi:hypothetical protein
MSAVELAIWGMSIRGAGYRDAYGEQPRH